MNKNRIDPCSSRAVLPAMPKILKPEAKQADILANPAEGLVEVLTEGQECPFCHFARLEREGNQIVCHICGSGRKIFT